MAQQWYISKDGKEYGPLTPKDLKKKADSGEIGPDDKVRPEDRQNWVKAAAVKGLFATKASTPSQTPLPVADHPTSSAVLPPPLPPGVSSGRDATPQPLASTSAQPPTVAVQPGVLRHQIEGLRQSIVQHVLNRQADLPDIEPIAAFRREYTDQQDRLTQLKGRIADLSKAKAEYELLDNTCHQQGKDLAAAEADLKQFARPLGKAAFEAVILGQLQDQPIFKERSALQVKLGELQAERDRLTPPDDAGMIQKTKAKAQQLVVVGKIKLEEMKIGHLEEQIGAQLIASNQEDSVRCERTAETLTGLAKHRDVIVQRKHKCDEARQALDEKKQQLAKTLQLANIEGSKSFNAERQSCEAQIAQIENQRHIQISQLPDRLLACEVQGTLGDLLRELRETQAQLQAAPQAESSSTGSVPSHSVRPFGDWYRASSLSQKSGRVQFVAWIAFGFVWIPYWYFWTAAPSGSLRGKWASLGRGGKVAFVALTCVLCLGLLRALPRHRADTSTPTRIGSTSTAQPQDAQKPQKTPQTDTAYAHGPNGEKILVGGRGLDSDWFYHYYLDTSGKEVKHGVERSGRKTSDLEESTYDCGVLVARFHYDSTHTLQRAYKRLDNGNYQRDEYQRLSDGSPAHFQTEVKYIVKHTDVGLIQEFKNVNERHIVADDTPLPPVSGRPLTANVGTAARTSDLVQRHNASLGSVKCIATEGQLVIDFDVDTSQWIPVNGIFPILVRLFDKNGNHLTHFTTAEGFTAFSRVYDVYDSIYQRSIQNRVPGEPKCILLKPKGNRFTYGVNIRDLRDASIVEIGFVERN